MLAVGGGAIFAGDTDRIDEITYEGLHDISSMFRFRGDFATVVTASEISKEVGAADRCWSKRARSTAPR